MNTKTTLILKPLSFLLTMFFSATIFSQTVITVTDCNLHGWIDQRNANTTATFTTGVPAPLLGNGALEYTTLTGTLGNFRSTGHHNTLLSSLTQFSYSSYIQSRSNNTDNIYVVLQVDKTGDGLEDDRLIFEPRWQTGSWVAGVLPDQGPTLVNTWQTWDMLNAIWWFGPPKTLNPEKGGEYFTLASYISQNPNAKIVNQPLGGGTGGIRLNVGVPPVPPFSEYWGSAFTGYVDAFTIVAGADTTIYDFEASIANAGADITIGSGANCTTLKGTGAGGVAPYLYSWTGGGNNSNSQNMDVCPSANTTYTLTVTDSSGCAGTDTVTVFVNAVLPVTFTNMKASQKDKSIQVDWTVANESNIQKYLVERSSDAINFTKAGEVAAKGSSSTQSYYWLDKEPGQANNYYRIKSIQADGKFFYTRTLIVKLNAEKREIKIVANPVTDQRLNLQFNDIQNSAGQHVFTRTIDHPGGSSSQIISLNKKIPTGVYYLLVVNKTTRYVQTIVIE